MRESDDATAGSIVCEGFATHNRDRTLGSTAYDALIVCPLETWARSGKKPANPKRFEIGPEIANVVLAHMSAKALSVQNKALDHALAPEARRDEVEAGAMVARNVLDRHLGRPVEKVAVASRVHVVFEGLRPDVFPTEPREKTVEVVEIAGDAGTEGPDG